MAARDPEEITDANVRYHDLAAGRYDTKWGISYDEPGRAQVLGKVRKALGEEPRPVGRALEIGAGTGYFTLNLMRAGLIERAVATDVSQGMLDALSDSAAELGLEVETVRSEAQSLPFEDDSFDLVLGHAVLHHLPDLEAAFEEFRRVLRPGGTLVFCGEPSHHGNRLAAHPKRAAIALAPLWRRALGAARRAEANGGSEGEEEVLEWIVDVHAFTPTELSTRLRAAGFDGIRVSGEELTASWFGWLNRTLESTAEAERLPVLWYRYAHRGYLILQSLDRTLLEPRLPPAIFYNLLVSARVPAAPGRIPSPAAQPAAAAAL